LKTAKQDEDSLSILESKATYRCNLPMLTVECTANCKDCPDSKCLYVPLKEAQNAVMDENRNTEFWRVAHKDDVAKLRTKIDRLEDENKQLYHKIGSLEMHYASKVDDLRIAVYGLPPRHADAGLVYDRKEIEEYQKRLRKITDRTPNGEVWDCLWKRDGEIKQLKDLLEIARLEKRVEFERKEAAEHQCDIITQQYEELLKRFNCLLEKANDWSEQRDEALKLNMMLNMRFAEANKILSEFWDKWAKEISVDLQSEGWAQVAEDSEAVLERLKTALNLETVKGGV
jgi:hypothetical protein